MARSAFSGDRSKTVLAGLLLLAVIGAVCWQLLPSMPDPNLPPGGQTRRESSSAAAPKPKKDAHSEGSTWSAEPPGRTRHATALGRGGSPAPQGAPQNAFDEAPQVAQDPYAQAEVLSVRESQPDAGGRVQRVRVLKTDFKYPYVRVDEVLAANPAGGPARLLRRTERVADHIVVRLREGADEEALRKINEKFGAKVRRKMRMPGCYLIELARPDLDAVVQAVADYTREAVVVAYAEPDYIVRAIATPNDPQFSGCWGLNNTGQTSGTADADIDAPEAWELSTGSRSVLVGIIDTGIDYTHPDLIPNLWTNPGETGLDALGRDKRSNGVDDDGNGFKDDWRGWNFITETNDPKDDNFHGTHVAGTIGAAGNNGQGVAGVCWNVSLVALKFLDSGGGGYTSDAAEATYYASKIGARLTSNSWGAPDYSQVVKDAIDDADRKGVLFVAAAGNATSNNDGTRPNYPSSFDSPNVIAVAATDHQDQLAAFSSYGPTTVDLSAPGVKILSTFPTYWTPAMTNLKNYAPITPDIDIYYAKIGGTSMATPHVSGVCALLKAYRPALSHLQIKAAVLASVDPLAALSGKVLTEGRLNAFRALVKAQTIGQEPFLATKTVTVDDDALGGSLGNADGRVNAGERIGLNILARNDGGAAAAGVTGTLSLAAPNPQITILANSASFGTIPAAGQAAGTGQFIFETAASLSSSPLKFVLTLRDGAGRTWTNPVHLKVHGRISGTITRDGAPLGGIAVAYSSMDGIFGNAFTASNGAYVANTVAGTYTLTVQYGDYPGAWSLTIPPNQVSDFAFTTATLAGRVVDASGAPVAGATVEFRGFPNGQAPLSTPADGRFFVTQILANTRSISVLAHKPGWSCSAIRTVSIPPSATLPDLVLDTPRYTVTDLGTLGGSQSSGLGLNASGQAAGQSLSAANVNLPFRWSGGVLTALSAGASGGSARAINDGGQVAGWVQGAAALPAIWGADGTRTDLGTLGGANGRAYGINGTGQVVGEAQLASGAYHAFLRQPSGTMADLGTLGGSSSTAFAVNSSGVVVGQAMLSSGAQRAFRWTSAGGLADLGTLGGSSSAAYGINASGQIVGGAARANYSRAAFLWTAGGGMRDLGALAGNMPTEAYGINDGGEAVGKSSTPFGERAFLWRSGGGLTDLNTRIPFEAGSLSEARAINTGGRIVGTGLLGGKTHAFLLTPINQAPLIVSAAWADPNPVTLPSATTVNVVASDPDSGPAPLTYTWSLVSGPGTVTCSPNGTAASSTSTATFPAAGNYTLRVTVSDSVLSVTSDVVVLVNAAPVPPAITTQPASRTVTAGQTANFSVVATGTAPLAYQWRKNGVNIPGATGASYTTPATTTSDSGALFSVVVSNAAGSVTSGSATLTVNPAPVPPAITTQPASRTVTAGQTAAFSVVATGTAPLAYQWRKNGVNIPGATAASYTTPATTTADSGALFSVVVSNAAGSVTSGNATLTVNPADTTGPALDVGSAVLKGTVSDPSGVANLTVNGVAVTVNLDGTWQKEVPLGAGTTSVTIVARDAAGNSTTRTVTIAK